MHGWFGGLWGRPDVLRVWAAQGRVQTGSRVGALAVPLTAVAFLVEVVTLFFDPAARR